MKNCTFTEWLKAAGIRAIKTFAQTAASLITVGALMSEVNWTTVFSAASVAAILSLLTSVAGLPELELASELKQTEKGAHEIPD
jgi:hypothetical protein